MSYLLCFFFYGFLLTTVLGMLASWIDRKVTARFQYRVGPPLLQPLYDIIKLLGKETIVPSGASKVTFFLSPVMGLGSVMLVSTILWVNNLEPGKSFLGDIIVVIYLFMIPSLSIMIGGFASANPLASIGASREMKLILGYELPFVLAVLVPVIKSDFSIRLSDIVFFQIQNGLFIGTPSGVLAFIVALLCVQAKLGFVPFDIPEAETEIISGPLVEYSGVALAMFKFMKNMLLCALPFFLILLFLGGVQFQGVHLLWNLLKFIGVVFLITVIRNTNPRIKIDQAIRFFWGPMTIIGAGSVVLALFGQ
jgi:NADH-quinone oxidoreductase subunit H